MQKFIPEQLAKYFDQTLLKAYVSEDDFCAFCEESASYHFKMVAINSATVKLCKDFLKDSDVLVGAAIGFPLGQTTIEAKVFETEKAIEDGADEIDYVNNIVALKSKRFDFVRREMQQITDVCRKHDKKIKVIFENCYLTQAEKRILCEIALDVGPDFIKTSTGFGTGGATVEDVAFMKSIVRDRLKVKAAGGIRTLDDALKMIEAGAERIGTSAGVTIIEELKRRIADEK